MPSTFTRLNRRVDTFKGKAALITGASAGLGEEFAKQLADLGAVHLVLTARRDDRLQALKSDLLKAHPKLRVDTIVADLADEAAVTKLIADLQGGGLDGFTCDISD